MPEGNVRIGTAPFILVKFFNMSHDPLTGRLVRRRSAAAEQGEGDTHGILDVDVSDPTRSADFARRAQAQGWDGIGAGDSQNLTGDPYVFLALRPPPRTRWDWRHP